MTTRVSSERARRIHLDLARHSAESGKHPGAMRQIVRRLRELDTPEADILAATGMSARQLERLMTRSVPSSERYVVGRDNAGFIQLAWIIDGTVRVALPLTAAEALTLSQALEAEGNAGEPDG